MTLRGRTLLASGFHAPVLGEVDILTDVLIDIDESGTIAALHRPDQPNYAAIREARDVAGMLVTLPPGAYLLPGFVDLHVHAPQYAQLGTALDVPLEVWLQTYTFPLEARYADLGFARTVYGRLVDDLLASGTTTALYFATLHREATELLVDLCLEKGQRALIGKVAMDHPDACPPFYRDASAKDAVEGTRALIDYVAGHARNDEGLVLPVVTPRFIPACTDAALEALGALARDCGCHVQTHCSESDWEHAHVLDRHDMTDTQSLKRFGLLGRRTVLAHGNFLTDSDLETIREAGAAVAHCPLSNVFFANAVFPLRAALEKGVHVGLGTDISGGPSGSMLDNARGAVMVSRLLQSGVDPRLPQGTRSVAGKAAIDFREAFHLATAGGGIALDLPVGIFAPGYRFDAMVIDTTAPEGSIRLFDGLETGDTILSKIVFTASKGNIGRVWVGGRQVR